MFSNGPTIVTNGLVLALDAGDRNSYVSGSTTWFDLTGVNNGTLTNGPTFDTGSGGSIVFDGSNDYVNIPSFSFTSDFTVGFWEMITGGTISNNQAPIGNVGNGDDINHYIGYIRMYNRTLDNDAIVSTTPTQLNIWYNYVFTRQGTTYRLYANGNLNNTNTYSVFSWDISAIGSGNVGYFQGRIPSIQMYNRALTSQEVLQNYNATKGRFNL